MVRVAKRRRAGGGVRSLTAAAALAGALASAGVADARPLQEIRARGVLSLCAHPDALPFASRKGDPPGFQIELARALAERLGVGLDVQWILVGFHYGRVDCDVIMDTIADREAQRERPVRWSKPYQRSGVALAVRPEADGIAGFDDLDGRHRVGVQIGSLAHMMLERRGVRTISFAFEGDMLDALAAGEIDAAAVTPATVGYYYVTHPDAGLKLHHVYERVPELSWDLAVGMRRSDRFLRKAVDDAVDAILADGTVAGIYARYGIEHRPPATGARRAE